MSRLLVVLALALGLLAGHALSTGAAPSVKGGGGVGGTCATANALGKFSSAFTLACSGATDDGTNVTLTSRGLLFSADNAQDVGTSGATRPRDINMGRHLAVNTTDVSVIPAATPGIVVDSGSATVAGIALMRGILYAPLFQTATRCANTGTPAVCAAAAAGSVVIAAAATSVVVNTTAVTANSQVFAMIDRGLGTLLSVTCDTTSDLTTGSPAITARTAGTSFTIAVPIAPAANPMCLSYFIVN